MDFKAWPQEATEWALQGATPANEKLELYGPSSQVPHAKKNTTAYEAQLGEAGTWYDPMEDTKPSPTTQEINKTFNDVEMAMSFVKNTLGYLDQALNIVEQRLGGIQDVLSARESLTNRERTLPHFETLYNSIPQAAKGDALAEEQKREFGEPYNPEIDHEYFDEGLQPGDSSHWWFAGENHSLQEDWDGNGRERKRVPFPTWEGVLRKESEADSLGYAADDEISPHFAKVFEN
jgi:hypothetical protein